MCIGGMEGGNGKRGGILRLTPAFCQHIETKDTVDSL